jgi:hypothetical protein
MTVKLTAEEQVSNQETNTNNLQHNTTQFGLHTAANKILTDKHLHTLLHTAPHIPRVMHAGAEHSATSASGSELLPCLQHFQRQTAAILLEAASPLPDQGRSYTHHLGKTCFTQTRTLKNPQGKHLQRTKPVSRWISPSALAFPNLLLHPDCLEQEKPLKRFQASKRAKLLVAALVDVATP